MKKIMIIVMAFVMLVGLSSCGIGNEYRKFEEITMDGKTIKLNPGDIVTADVMNEPEYTYKGKNIKQAPLLYNGITIGSNIDAVIKVFGIKPGYSNVFREIDTPEEDGTTNIVSEKFVNTKFFEKEGVLDAVFSFGYKKDGDKWKMVSCKELDKEDYDLFFQIDFLGESLAYGMPVKEKQVISYRVERVK